MAEDKKLIIDEDWKEEAQREKEMLAAAIEQEKEAKRRPPLPPASFAMLASSLATQAMMNLGAIENPVMRKAEINLDEAKFPIDMLGMLEQKTKGNLSPEEAKLLEALLFDLRMQYVQAAKP